MTDRVRKGLEGDANKVVASRQNSYAESAVSTDTPATPETPDIQQPGPAGDFGNGSNKTPAEKSTSTALPTKHSAGRTPGDQPELAHQADDGIAKNPGDAAEPSNAYSGT
jgi:hypothetical protein